MTTFYTNFDVPRKQQLPEWMREERFMYCDQTIEHAHSHKYTAFWNKLKKIFA